MTQGRDPTTGKFTKGNRASPGRKPRETEAGYLRATVGAVSLADWIQIVRKAAEQAKSGDHRARAWLSELLIGMNEIETRLSELEAKLNEHSG